MASNLARYKEDLNKLLEQADGMLLDLAAQEPKGPAALKKEEKALLKEMRVSFRSTYQRWYTEASAVMRQLLPERLAEFESYYRIDPKRKSVNQLTYRIQDWLNGTRASTDYTGKKYFEDAAVVLMAFQTQTAILQSAAARFDSSLLDIRTVLQADLFDSELAAARELLNKGFVRPSGVLAGVVLERHLSEVCGRHQIAVRKKSPGVSDLNELLKANETIDVPMWRFIQRLGDLRNLCAHNKEREPTVEEARELIEGCERITKTLY